MIHSDIFRIKSNILQHPYNKEDIYEWSIDEMFRYNLPMTSQQMTTTAMFNQTLHGCNQLIAHVLFIGFIGQFKGWWEEHLIIEDRNIIHDILVTTNRDESDLQDGNILPETMLFNITSDDDSGVIQEDSSKLFPSSRRYQYILLMKSDRNKVHNKDFFKGLLESQYKKIKPWEEITCEQNQQASWFPKPTEDQFQGRNLGSFYKQFGPLSYHTRPNKQTKSIERLENPFSSTK